MLSKNPAGRSYRKPKGSFRSEGRQEPRKETEARLLVATMNFQGRAGVSDGTGP